MPFGPLKNLTILCCLLSTLAAILPAPVQAQRYHIQTFREQDGLASNKVNNAAQDALGKMWFGTRNGMSVFDGIKWQTITSRNPAAPNGDGLVSIDDGGGVWWINIHWPFKASRLVDGNWQKLPKPDTFSRFSTNVELKTWVDEKGHTTLIIASNNGPLQIWQNEVWSTFSFDQPHLHPHSLSLDGSHLLLSTKTGLFTLDLKSLHKPYQLDLELPDGQIMGACSDNSSGSLWVISDQWLVRYQGRKLAERFSVSHLFFDKTKQGLSLCMGPSGGIYFSDSTQVVHFHPHSGFETFTTTSGLATDSGNHVMMDRENNIWISSTRGISKIMSRSLACYNSDHGLLNGEVGSVIERASGAMVLGQRGGLTFLDSIPHTISFDDNLPIYSRVTDLAEDSQGRLWIAANHKGLGLLQNDESIQWFNREHGLTDAVYAIMPHPEYGLFVGTLDGLYRQIGDRFERVPLPGLENAHNLNIRRLVPLSTGGFAIATRSFGLFLWKDGAFTSLPGKMQDGSNNVYTVFERPEGGLLVCTNSGLFRVQDNNLVRTTAPDPVIRRPIYGMVQDQSGQLWFGTDNGAIIWDGNQQTRLTANEGLLGSEINRDAFMITRDGNIWIGTDSGLSIFRPELDIPSTNPPVLSLSSMMINGVQYPPRHPVQITGPLASLVFKFDAPYFSSEEHLEFVAEITSQSDIDLPSYIMHWPGVLPMTNVPPGRFQVHVVARTPEGLESNIVTTPLITIIPPLMERWFIKALSGLAIALMLWLLFAYFSGRQYAQRLENEVRIQTRDLRKSEETARLESERLKSTLESISDGVVVIDGNNQVVLFNKAAEGIFLGSLPPKIGDYLEDILPVRALLNPDQKKQYKQLLKDPSSVRLKSQQLALYSGQNKTRWIELSGVPITGPSGGQVFAFRDITSRLQTEQNKHRSQKLESLGLLAGGIAHDFNNLLTIMMGNLSLAESTLITTAVENVQLEKIRLASRRAQNLTRQLLTFAKGGGPMRESTNLIPIIQDSVSFNLSGSNVQCQMDIPEDLSWAEVDAVQISQIIGNLVINARQAMSGGGQLEVSAQNSDTWPGIKSDHAFVVITIQDHGKGISESDQARIFDPYFTTREKGTGLGLAIAHSIAEKHDGRLTVESTLGQGSVFQLILPACDGSRQTSPNSTLDQTDQVTSGLNILFMDDEDEIRFLMSQMLDHLGHHWTGVPHGESAHAAYLQAQQQGRPFDLVILDLTIPGAMGGLETLAELRKINPKVKVIVASGYSDDPVMAHFQKFGFSGILNKPFAQDDLRRVLASLLGPESFTS